MGIVVTQYGLLQNSPDSYMKDLLAIKYMRRYPTHIKPTQGCDVSGESRQIATAGVS